MVTARTGMSVGVATGIANGGMMVQLMILFPLWSPPLVFLGPQTPS